MKKDIPTEAEFMAFARTLTIYREALDYSLSAKYATWVDDGWKDGHSRPIKNWKLKLRTVMPYLKPVFNTDAKELPSRFDRLNNM